MSLLFDCNKLLATYIVLQHDLGVALDACMFPFYISVSL